MVIEATDTQNDSFSVTQQPKSILSRLTVEVSISYTIRHTYTHTHTHTQSVGLLCTSDHFVTEVATCTATQETNINALSVIRTRDPSTEQSQNYALDRTPLGMSEKLFAL